LKLRIKNLLVFSLENFKSSDIEEDQIPESVAGFYWNFFCNCSEFSISYKLFKWNPSTDTDTKFQGQKRPLQSFNLIRFVMQITVTALSSHWSFQLGHWYALNSRPLQYLPCPNAQHILMPAAMLWFTVSSQMRRFLPTCYFTLWDLFSCYLTLLNPALHLYFPNQTSLSVSEALRSCDKLAKNVPF